MKQQEASLAGAPIYVTANALMNDDVTLSAAIHIARTAGADGFELRRELLPPAMQRGEIEDIRAQLQIFAFPPVYSIPLPLCKKGRFEREPLLRALEDAHAFGCHLVKFSPIGMDAGDNNFAWLGELRSLLESAAADLVVTVENDQGAASGNMELWQSFFEQARAVECPIWMTFDLGNWTCVGSDALQAAQRLGRYVAYVHAKAVERKDGECISRPLRAASAPYPALAYFPPDAPRAIEFPLAGEDYEAVSRTLRTYILWLRSGNFVL